MAILGGRLRGRLLPIASTVFQFLLARGQEVPSPVPGAPPIIEPKGVLLSKTVWAALAAAYVAGKMAIGEWTDPQFNPEEFMTAVGGFVAAIGAVWFRITASWPTTGPGAK